jgi:hypothetical protein
MRVEISRPYVDAADELLAPSGFVRRARSQEWSKRSEVDRIWVHLNFGKGLINPSFGVEYSDLKKRWPNLPGGVYGTMKMLVGCVKTPRLYSVNDAPCDLIDDLRESGLVVMAELQDRMKVLEMLRSPNSAKWPVPSFSDRIRLAPILLCGLGRIEEAFTLADDFLPQSVGKDQIVPRYDVFVRALRVAAAG